MGDSEIQTAAAAAQAAAGTHQHGAPPARALDGQPSLARRAQAERAVRLPGVPGGEAADAAPRGDAQAEPSEIARLVERERSLAAFLPDPYLVTDGWGTIHYANAAACALFDRPARLLSRRPLAMLVANAARGGFRDGVQRLHALAGGAGSWTVEFAGEDGVTRPRTVVAQTLHDAMGAVAGIRWLVRAAPAEAGTPALALPALRAAAAPRSSHGPLLARVSALLGSASTDPDAAMARLAEALVPALGDWCAVDLLGDSPAAAPVTRVHATCAARGGDARAAAGPWAAPRLDDPRDLTAAVLRGVGPRLWRRRSGREAAPGAAGAAVPACGSALAVPLVLRGRTLGALTLGMAAPGRRHSDADIDAACQVAERAALALDNARLLQAAERAREVKSNFLAAMSHELRTPLTAVLGYAELLGDGVAGPVTATQRQHLARITAGGEQLLALVNEILDFSRAESGEATLRLVDVDGAALAREALAAVDAAADGKGLAVRVELPAAGIPMRTDGRKLRQILATLLGNAVKFTDAGEVALTARGAAGQVLFEVRDTGPGIAEHDLERVFEPFWQVVQTATRRHGGTGLGLSLARTLARLLGGDVRVTSAPGHGSCFTLRLPAVLAPEPVAPPPAASAGASLVPPPTTALPR